MKRNIAIETGLRTNRDDFKSVRTTLNLTESTIDMMKNLAESTGMTQQDLLHWTCQHIGEVDAGQQTAPWDESKSEPWWPTGERTRKTLVLTKRTMNQVSHSARKWDVSRDDVVESSLWRFKRLYDAAEEHDKEVHKQALTIVTSLAKKCAHAEISFASKSNQDHAVLARLSAISQEVTWLEAAIERFLKDGTPVDPYDTRQG